MSNNYVNKVIVHIYVHQAWTQGWGVQIELPSKPSDFTYIQFNSYFRKLERKYKPPPTLVED